MDAHRIKIFNRADDYALILVVAHDLHFVFLPAKQAFFDQYLSGGGHLEAVLHHLLVFLAIVGDAAP